MREGFNGSLEITIIGQFMRRIPFVIAMIILAAHFLRTGASALTLLCLLLPFLLFIKRSWVITTTSLFAYFGGIIWLFVTYDLYLQRAASDQPWARMILILGTVAIFTFAAGILLKTAAVRKLYSPSKGSTPTQDEENQLK